MKSEQINKETDIPNEITSTEITDNLNGTDDISSSSEKESIQSFFSIKSNSSFIAIINICASAFGSGCLTFPHFVDSIGIFNSFLVYIFVSVCLYYSFDFLRGFVVDIKYNSFSVMTEKVLGKNWLIVFAVSSSIFYLIGIINHMNVCYSIFRMLLINEESYKKYYYGMLYLLITYGIEIFLCLYTRYTQNVYLISFVAVIAFSFFIALIIIGGINGLTSEKFESKKFFHPFGDKNITDIVFEFIYAALMYIYGFSYHSTFPTFLGNVNKTGKSSKKINNISFGVICLSYIIISFFGYLYKKAVPGQLFLDRMNEENNFINIFLGVFAFIYLFSLIPHRYITVRDGYKHLIGNKKFNDKIDLIFVITCLFIANCIIFLDQEITRGENDNYNIFSFCSNIFGGLLGVLIAFLLPIINYVTIDEITEMK